MSNRGRRRVLLSVVLLGTLLGAPQMVSADGVGQAQRNVDNVLNQLDDLQNQMGQLDEDYGAAQDRQAQLQQDIAAAQVRIDALDVKLGGVHTVLAKIALDRFIGADTSPLSPIFADSSTYSVSQQKAALGMVAIDSGETSIDDLQQLVDQVSAEQASVQRKTTELAGLVKTLAQKKSDYAKLEKLYTAKYAQAQHDLGAAKLKAEQDRRLALEVVKRAKVAAAAKAARAPRGGGSTSGGSRSGGSSGSSGNYPAPSGKAGIAIKAALSQLGVPYVFATSLPGVSFDCSGLTAYAWGQAGVSLPHVSRLQYAALPHIPVDQAQPGDLIFYYTPIGHVGLYLGNGQMIHAPHTGDVVNVTTVHWNAVVGVARPG